MTPLDLLAAAIRARAGASGSMVAPAAILWTDHREEWRGLIPAARSHIPELLTLGDYRPDDRTGPAIWLRCVVDGSIGLSGAVADGPPIIYLPGIERGKLRAGESCPEELRPLVELMYRGAAWHHVNGRDWSVRAFLELRSDGVPAGPGLSIANDAATTAALLRAVGEVGRTPLKELRGGRLDANDFNRRVGVELARDILRWMGNAKVTREEMDRERWEAFCDEARHDLRFDPETDADVEAGARLAKGDGRWAGVWSRFNEAPDQFPGIAELLARSRPGGVLILEGRDRWPDLNDEDEATVRDTLAGLSDLSHGDARRRIRGLEKEHGRRREWVWARLGRSPFAKALRPLADLAAATTKGIGGATPDEIARVYGERGWQADRSAREALALTPEGHSAVVRSAIQHLYERWLDDSARAFQAAVKSYPLRSQGSAEAPGEGTGGDAESPGEVVSHPALVPSTAPVAAAENECIVFVDGLRYELGHGLAGLLEERDLNAAVRARWAAIPTVTATAKPAVTPVAGQVAGDRLGADFAPVLRGSTRPATAAALREAMKQRGYQIVGEGELALGPTTGSRGWLETGKIDRHGHHHDAIEFARIVQKELERLARQIAELLESGWESVRIVTDHGWLLLPRGLPLVTLPRHLAASKWARCAALAENATPDAPLWPWHWSRNQYFASPPGVACFSKRPEYAHGGLSVQECLIPEIRVGAKDGTAGRSSGKRVAIRSVSWMRMRCTIEVSPSGADLTADLRLASAAGESVAARPKSIDADGCASLILADDAHEDAALVVVVTAPDGRVLAQRATTKGESSP